MSNENVLGMFGDGKSEGSGATHEYSAQRTSDVRGNVLEKAQTITHHGGSHHHTSQEPATNETGGEMSRKVTVANERGLHLRPCSAVAAAVGNYQATVTISNGSQTGNAASVMDLLLLAAAQGTELVLSATGPDAQDALDAVAALIANPAEEAPH